MMMVFAEGRLVAVAIVKRLRLAEIRAAPPNAVALRAHLRRGAAAGHKQAQCCNRGQAHAVSAPFG